eukprot:3176516-Rhodomonas_salina.1
MRNDGEQEIAIDELEMLCFPEGDATKSGPCPEELNVRLVDPQSKIPAFSEVPLDVRLEPGMGQPGMDMANMMMPNMMMRMGQPGMDMANMMMPQMMMRMSGANQTNQAQFAVLHASAEDILNS